MVRALVRVLARVLVRVLALVLVPALARALVRVLARVLAWVLALMLVYLSISAVSQLKNTVHLVRMNDEQLAEIREGNLNCVRLHLWLRQKQQLLQRRSIN